MLNEILEQAYSLMEKGINPTCIYISYKDFCILEKECEFPIKEFLDLKIIIKDVKLEIK